MYDWIIPAVIGWCGTKWPWHIGGGGGGGDGDPWPPNCAVCGPLIGALSALVINQLVGHSLAEAGFFANAFVSLVAGKVGSDIVGNVARLARGK
jgi:hypothetical protein